MGITTGENQQDDESGATRRSLTGMFADRVDANAADAARGRAAEVRRGQEADVIGWKADGKDAIAEAVADTNHETTMRGALKDIAALLEKAGIEVSGIETTGLGPKELAKIRQFMEGREADNDARKQMLLALQAYLDGLDAGIAALDDQIDALDGLLEIVDSGEALDPNNPAHRELLKRSGIPPEEWDTVTRDDIEQAKRDREAARAEMREERDRVENIMQNGTEAEIEHAAKTENIQILEAAVDNAGGIHTEGVGEIIEERADNGNISSQNDIVAAVGELDNLNADDLLSGTTSFANMADPNSTLRDIAPPMRPQFETASHQTAAVEPDAQIDLTRQREPDAALSPIVTG